MFNRLIALFIVASFTFLSAVPESNAAAFFGAPSEEEPSVFYYGYSGLGLGLLSGLAAGYVRYADAKDNTNDILKSTAFGGLAGIGVGVLLGVGDAASGDTGMGAIVLRDMHLGGLLGLTVGTIWGGIKAIDDERWETVGKGAAWGYLAGVGFGVVVALIEGPQIVSQRQSTVKRVRHGVVFLQDSRLDNCPGYGIAYLF